MSTISLQCCQLLKDTSLTGFCGPGPKVQIVVIQILNRKCQTCQRHWADYQCVVQSWLHNDIRIKLRIQLNLLFFPLFTKILALCCTILELQ